MVAWRLRDQQGLEVDFVIPRGDRRLLLVEAKASRTVFPGDADALERLARATRSYAVDRVLVHRAARTAAGRALRPGTRALGLEDLLAEI